MSRRLYTDGASSPDGRGGWSWVLVSDDKLVSSNSGSATETTNQKMELTAVIHGLVEAAHPDEAIEVCSDSAYITNCFKDGWRIKWDERGWTNAKGRPVENALLWRTLFEIVDKRVAPTLWTHVRGHDVNGDRWNHEADRLAVAAKPTKTKGLL